MTAICYKDGILAADTAVYADRSLFGYTQKIFIYNKYIVYGCSGHNADVYRFKRWLATEDPERYDVEKGFSAIVIDNGGDTPIIRVFDYRGENTQIKAKFFAIGCGQHICTGAMAAGATAIEAVVIATKYDDACGGDIHYIDVNDIDSGIGIYR